MEKYGKRPMLWLDWGNTAQAATAGLGSIGLRELLRMCYSGFFSFHFFDQCKITIPFVSSLLD